MSLTARLHAQGFDRSHAIPFEKGARVGCSQCDAVCVNGTPCHETGCPNQTFECKGCNAEVSRRGAYCPDCQ
jgi:hypothetical protein